MSSPSARSSLALTITVCKLAQKHMILYNSAYVDIRAYAEKLIIVTSWISPSVLLHALSYMPLISYIIIVHVSEAY